MCTVLNHDSKEKIVEKSHQTFIKQTETKIQCRQLGTTSYHFPYQVLYNSMTLQIKIVLTNDLSIQTV